MVLVLLLPSLTILALVVGYPLVHLVLSSFQDFGLKALFGGGVEWVGLDNYVTILTDEEFLPVLLRTFLFTAATVVACIGIGMAMAQTMMGLSKSVRLLLNVALILAWAIPTVTAALVWRWLIQPTYGVVNWIITQMGVFGDFTSHDWLATSISAFFIIMLLKLWHAVPFVALTLYAAQSQIPRDYYEAAMLDGANAFQIYRAVTLPHLRPILYLVTVLSIIWHFNTFNQIWLLTQGGPAGGTTTLDIWAFKTAFASNEFGQGSAIAVVTAILLVIITSFYVRRLVRTGELA